MASRLSDNVGIAQQQQEKISDKYLKNKNKSCIYMLTPKFFWEVRLTFIVVKG